MDTLGRFSDRAVDYAAARPSYPDAVVEAVLEPFAGAGDLLAADLGSGTGLFARLLAARGVHVAAVEPNAAMRAAAEPAPRVQRVGGVAEHTPFRPLTFDLVTVAQAFHWFDGLYALREMHRILKPRGRLAIVWSEKDETDDVTGAFGAIVRRAAPGARFAQPDSKRPDAVFARPFFIYVHERWFPYEQVLDADGLRRRAQSASYTPADGPAKDRMLQELDGLHRASADAAGRVRLRYRTHLLTAHPA